MLDFRPRFLDQLTTLSPSERQTYFRNLIRKYVRIAGLIIVLGMIWMIWAAMLSRGLDNRNALASSQAARNLVNGKGFTTLVIRPLSFHFSPVVENHPDYFTPPFTTILKASLFLFAGDTNRMVILASGLGWIVCGLLIFHLVHELAGRSGPAYYALALWCINIAAAQYAVDGDNVTWSAALFTTTLWCLHRGWISATEASAARWTRDVALREMPYGWAFASGLSASLFTLCEPLLAPCLWLPLLWFWMRWPARARLPVFRSPIRQTIDNRRRNKITDGYRRRLLGIALAPAAVLLGAWYGYNLVRSWPECLFTLRAFKLAMFSYDYPGESIFRYAVPPIDLPVIFWFGQMQEAAVNSLKATIPLPEALVYLCGMVPLAFFVAGLFLPLESRVRALRRGLVAPFILSLFLSNLWSINARYFGIYIPAVLIVSVLVMHHVLGRRWQVVLPMKDTHSMRLWIRDLVRHAWIRTRRHQVYGLFLLLAAIPSVLLRANLPPKKPAIIPPGLEYIASRSKPGDVVLTDDPWLVAWYTQRAAVWLPQRIEDLDTMIEKSVRFDWVYINNAAISDPREIGDWWPELTKDSIGWREFRAIDGNFDRERVMLNSN